MSNIIDGIDLGMGYEKATKWEPGLQYWSDARKAWIITENETCAVLSPGLTYRRPLPILANHPEAIPLDPGEVLQFGERYLMRKGKALTYFGEQTWGNNGKHYADETRDIIARLPKVVKPELPNLEIVVCDAAPPGTIAAMTDGKVVGKITNIKPEAEKAKEEKVKNTVTIKTSDDFRFCLGSGTITLGEKDISNLLAEVKRMEEAKRICTDDWCMTPMGIQKCKGSVGGALHREYLAFYHIENGFRPQECRKLNLPPDLIAALNAEIDAKAGG